MDLHFIIRVVAATRRWRGACGVTNQFTAAGTFDKEQVTCSDCLDWLTTP